MELVKENIEKEREVYETETSYIKHWSNKNYDWLLSHVKKLDQVTSNYIINYGVGDGFMWAEFKKLAGKPASEFEHTPAFVERVVKFCKDNYKKTYPYAHGDWVLSNIIIDGENFSLCDWDNLDVYPEEEVWKKMEADLVSAFGNQVKDYFNDSSSI